MTLCWNVLREAALPALPAWEDGLAHAHESLRPLTRRLLDALAQPEAPAWGADELELWSALVALVARKCRYADPPRFVEVCAFLVERGGIALALEATVGALAYQQYVAATIAIYTQDLAFLIPAGQRLLEVEPWAALRAAVRAAGPAACETAVARARVLRASARPDVRFALAWAFPHDPALFTDEDAGYGLSCDEDPGPIYDLACLRHVELQVASRVAVYGIDGLPDAETLVRHLGAQAVSPLRRRVALHGYDLPAEAVAGLGGRAAIAVLAEAADREKEVLPLLVAAAASDPAATLAALDDVLGSTRRGLRQRLSRSPLLRPILETLHRQLTLVAPAPEASAAELPPELASPPWRAAREGRPKKRGTAAAASASPAVPPVAYPETLDWGKRDPATLFAVQTQFEELALKRIAAYPRLFLLNLHNLSDGHARQVLEQFGPETWWGESAEVEGLLARFGLEILDRVLAYVRRQPDRIEALLVVDSPRVAPLAAHIFATSKRHGEVAARWLEGHPRAATLGLLAALPGAKGKARESLSRALEHLRARAPQIVEECRQASGAGPALEEEQARVKGKKVTAPKLPAFIDLATLPRPRLKVAGAPGGASLSAAATADLLGLLILSDRREPRPELGPVKAALDPVSLDALAWSIFAAWLAAGGPSKHPVGLDVLGHLGDPRTLRTLGAAARAWAPGGVPQRAQAAVEVLALADDDAGLLAIHHLTQVRSRALARHADKILGQVAERRGLTRDDLVDRLVPDLGLEPDGTLGLDFGPRRFAVGFDEHMVPFVTEGSGRRLADLPRPGAGDDAEMAAAATAGWKELRQKAREIGREQGRRLEAALGIGRRFAVGHFEAFFAQHPLLQHLARRLLWGTHGQGGASGPDGDLRPVMAFRVAEDGTYADLEDRQVTLDPAARVGLVHPLALPEGERVAWSQRFADYALLQPFPQLGRSTFALTGAEHGATELGRYAGREVPTARVLGLDRLGWVRTDPIQGGRVHAWQKPGAGWAALLPLEPGIYLGAPLDEPTQTLGPLVVIREGDPEPVPLGELDPVVFSELVRDLEGLIG